MKKEISNNNIALITETLKDIWKGHYLFVGDQQLDIIIDHAKQNKDLAQVLETNQFGDNFDLKASIQILYEAAQFAAAIFSVYQGMKELLGRPPKKEELEKEVKTKAFTFSKPIDNKSHLVVNYIYKENADHKSD